MLVLEAASTISTPYIYLLSRFRSIFFSQLLLLMQILIPSLHKYPFTVSPFSPPFSSQFPLCIAIVEQTKRKKNERKGDNDGRWKTSTVLPSHRQRGFPRLQGPQSRHAQSSYHRSLSLSLSKLSFFLHFEFFN